MYHSKIPLIKSYFKKILETAVNLSVVNYYTKGSVVLDFGCGEKELSKMIRSYIQVYNYDIDKEYSEVEDYRKLKPSIVFALNVFEHLTKEEIEQTIKDFKKMNKNLVLITAIPKENILSRIGDIVAGSNKSHILTHKTTLKEVNEILNKDMRIVERRDVYFMSEVSKWEMRK